MSSCCFFTILVIVVVSILIIYVLHKIYTKLRAIDRKKENKPTTTATTTTENATSDPQNAVIDASDEVATADNNTSHHVIFKLHNNNPAVSVCSRDTECEYLEFCNIQICRHLTNNAKMHNDKNTLRNVTYIHLLAEGIIVVFVTKNDNVCAKEQEVSLEDINYINSYTSKFPELSIYTIFYDKENGKFIDFAGRQHEEYTIELRSEEQAGTHREILQYPRLQPSAPAISGIVRCHENKGNFYYIAKQ